MNRENFYFLQPVTESELDQAFAYAETAMNNLMIDQALVGIFQGGSVAQHTGTPNLTVDISGPLYGYDQNGQRLFLLGPVFNQQVSADTAGSVSTAVSGGGNEKWVSIFIKFARVLSDPRVDGNSITIQFQSTESYQILIVQGAEATLGTAVRPPLDPTAILLADVQRTFGQTQVLNANIDITRRQDVFVDVGAPGGLSIRAGTPQAAIAAMLTNLNDHILGMAGAHPATGITTAATGAWADASTVASGTVQSSLNGIVSALASTAGGGKVGAVAVSGSPFSLSSGTTASQLSSLLSKLNTGISVVQSGTASAMQNLAAPVAGQVFLVPKQGLYTCVAASALPVDSKFVYPATNLGGAQWVHELYDLLDANLGLAAIGPISGQAGVTASRLLASVVPNRIVETKISGISTFSGSNGSLTVQASSILTMASASVAGDILMAWIYGTVHCTGSGTITLGALAQENGTTHDTPTAPEIIFDAAVDTPFSLGVVHPVVTGGTCGVGLGFANTAGTFTFSAGGVYAMLIRP